MKRRNPKNRYITRIEHSSRNSGFYWVRIYQNSVRHQSEALTFTDLEFGGKRKALAAARAWRDKKLEEFDIGPESLQFRRYQTSPRSNTGVVGVCRLDYTKGNGRKVTAFSVQWLVTEGKNRITKTKLFSFKTDVPGSEEEAFKRAKAHRKAMEKIHYIGKL